MARVTYGFDDIALVPGEVTISPNEVDTSFQLGTNAPERLRIVREADWVVIDEMKKADLYYKVWQTFAVLLPVRTVGVMGDERTYDNVVAIRAVESVDGMTADWVLLPYDLLARLSTRIINEMKGVNRVCLDISSKPPSTIEWE